MTLTYLLRFDTLLGEAAHYAAPFGLIVDDSAHYQLIRRGLMWGLRRYMTDERGPPAQTHLRENRGLAAILAAMILRWGGYFFSICFRFTLFRTSDLQKSCFLASRSLRVLLSFVAESCAASRRSESRFCLCTLACCC